MKLPVGLSCNSSNSVPVHSVTSSITCVWKLLTVADCLPWIRGATAPHHYISLVSTFMFETGVLYREFKSNIIIDYYFYGRILLTIWVFPHQHSYSDHLVVHVN